MRGVSCGTNGKELLNCPYCCLVFRMNRYDPSDGLLNSFSYRFRILYTCVCPSLKLYLCSRRTLCDSCMNHSISCIFVLFYSSISSHLRYTFPLLSLSFSLIYSNKEENNKFGVDFSREVQKSIHKFYST